MAEHAESAVVDASVVVDLLAGTDRAAAAAARLRGCTLHVPAHLEAEVLSALGRLHRAEVLSDAEVEGALARLARLPAARHPLDALLVGAWQCRENVRLVDALYVELATQLDAPLLTTDRRLARACTVAEVIASA